jgi:heme/copper-type cytochrome/quinol oxidase subunit 2
MRKLFKSNLAQAGMVGAAIGILITIIIGALIYFSVAGSLDTTSIDAKLDGTPAANATTNANNQASTFFTIAPIIAVVIVAVVVIGYVNRIGG